MSGKIVRAIAATVCFCIAMLAPPALLAEPAPPSIPPANQSPPPLEAFAALPFIENPELSPSGTRVAARAAVAGRQLVLISSSSGQVSIGLGDYEFRWLRWVNDDWLIVSVGQAIPFQGEFLYVTRLVGVSADGKTVRPLPRTVGGQTGDDVLWIARDGSPRILLGYQNDIYLTEEFWTTVVEVNVATGRSSRVLRPRMGVMDYYANADGVVRLARSYDDKRRRSRLLARNTNDESFHEIESADHKADESLTIPTIFTADPAKAIVYDDDEEGYGSVFEYDLAAMKKGNKLFGVKGYDIDAILPDENGQGLAGIRYTDTRSRVHWFDKNLAEVQANIDKAVGTSKTAEIVSTNRDLSVLMVHVGAANHPGFYYLYRLDAGKMTVFSKVNAKLGNGPLAPVKTITYTARDGLEIPAVLTLPKDREAKNLPLILMPHGGPHVRDSESWDWWAQFLASRGYAVIQPNYRGSSGYGTAFAEKSEGEWGLKMQDDLNDAVDWMVKQGMADAGRVCIMGGSYGGYAAMRGAQRDGSRYRCAISYAGVSDLTRMLRYDRKFLTGNANAAYWKSEISDFKTVSPLNFPEQFSTPILLMHGKRDLRVPVEHSREMAEKLKAAGKNVRYVEQKEADHHFTREADRIEFLKEVESWLNAYNPA